MKGVGGFEIFKKMFWKIVIAKNISGGSTYSFIYFNKKFGSEKIEFFDLCDSL